MEEKENFPRNILGFVYFCLAIAKITLNWSFYKRLGSFWLWFYANKLHSFLVQNPHLSLISARLHDRDKHTIRKCRDESRLLVSVRRDDVIDSSRTPEASLTGL